MEEQVVLQKTKLPPVVDGDGKIHIPYNFYARPYQEKLTLAILQQGFKRAVAVWHRRAGKDKTVLNLMVQQAMLRVGVYYYFLPTYAQGRKIVWDGIDKQGFRFLDHIPEQIREQTNNTEMKIKLKNGSLIQVVASDNVEDSIVGTNPVGCIFSEYSLQDPKGWEFVRPILRENEGWALFIYTPRGKNHGWDLYRMAKKNPKWFCEVLTVDDTGIVTEEEIQEERDSGMPESMVKQEFYCSFDVATNQAFAFTEHDHVIDPIPIPSWAEIYMTFDWGFGAPFDIGWHWVDQDGRIYRFAEWYGWNGTPNMGLRITDSEIAEGVKERERKMGIDNRQIIRYCGHDSFSKKPDYKGGGQSKSTAEIFGEYGLFLSKADPSRQHKIRQFRERLRVKEGELPMFMCYSTCEHFIRTVPAIETHPANPEEIDTTGEDHPFDSSGQLCSMRPISHKPEESRVTECDVRIDNLMNGINSADDRDTINLAEDMMAHDPFYGGEQGEEQWGDMVQTIEI